MSRRPSQLSFNEYYLRTWWAVLALTSAHLWVSGLIHPFVLFLGTIACFWVMPPTNAREHYAFLRSWYGAIFLCLTTAAAAFTQYTATHDKLALIGGVCLVVLPLFLLRKNKSFGFWMALLVSELLCLLSVIVEGTGASYCLFILFLISVVFHLNASNLISLSGSAGALHQTVPKGYFSQFAPPLGTGLMFGALIFLFLPRSFHLESPFGIEKRDITNTGYTGSVTLDGASELTESSTVAMVLESENPYWLMIEGPNFYFRGNTVDQFDGVRWTASPTRQLPYSPSVDLRYTSSYRFPARKVTIFREPTTSAALFYPQILLGLNSPWTLPGGVKFDTNSNLIRQRPEFVRFSYEVLVLATHWQVNALGRSLKDIRRALKSIPKSAKGHPYWMLTKSTVDRYLQIPDSVADRPFFKEWIKEVGTDSENITLIQILQSLRRNFQTRFEANYVHQFSKGVPFENFLTKDRKGHCEYFATAAALFLRAQGIPTRLVLGYRGGTFNRISQVFEVRESNAHAWIEVYSPDTGWVQFEATPLLKPAAPNAIVASVMLYVNAARFFFNRYVADYNFQTQKQLFQNLAKVGTSANWEMTPAMRKKARWFLGIACILAVLVAWRLSRKRRRRSTQAPLPAYYRAFSRRIALGGWRRAPGETFSMFHRRLVEAGLNKTILEAVDQGLEKDLYTRESLDSAQRVELKRAIRALSVPRRPSKQRAA